jgi:hypothetical protein
MSQHWLGTGIVTTLTTAAYQRVSAVTGDNVGEPLAISAYVIQDGGEGFTSETCLVWTDETLALIAALKLDCEELVGCEEAIEDAFFAAEREHCRVAYVKQRTEAA